MSGGGRFVKFDLAEPSSFNSSFGALCEERGFGGADGDGPPLLRLRFFPAALCSTACLGAARPVSPKTIKPNASINAKLNLIGL